MQNIIQRKKLVVVVVVVFLECKHSYPFGLKTIPEDLQDGRGVDVEITFLPTNTSKIYLHVEQLLRTPTECWQKTSDFPKGKKFPMYLPVWLTGSWCSGKVSDLSL